MNHLDLPVELFQFTKPIVLESLPLPKIVTHSWCSIPITDFLTEEGIKWFADRNLALRSTAFVFKIIKNFEGPIHIDSVGSVSAGFAFNFVISGYGSMQWVNNIEGNENVSYNNDSKYIMYNNVKSFDVTDTWTGNAALVRIDVPHRIISFDEERYCVSIRTQLGTNPKTFEDAVHMI